MWPGKKRIKCSLVFYTYYSPSNLQIICISPFSVCMYMCVCVCGLYMCFKYTCLYILLYIHKTRYFMQAEFINKRGLFNSQFWRFGPDESSQLYHIMSIPMNTNEWWKQVREQVIISQYSVCVCVCVWDRERERERKRERRQIMLAPFKKPSCKN
jgi:hypothetical protein